MTITRSFALVLLSVCLVTLPMTAEAATFTVNSTEDAVDAAIGNGICATNAGLCSLRAAIQEANALNGADTIRLRTGLYQTSLVGVSEDACASGDLDITDDLTLIGTGAKNTFVNGGKLDRVFHIVDSTVTISDMTIQNGLGLDGPYTGYAVGGGIYNDGGTLILKGVTISNNVISGGGYSQGGGLYNVGNLTITKSALAGSTITKNTVFGPDAYGGGIFTGGGSFQIKISGASIFNNTVHGEDYGVGGGISNNGGHVTLTQTAVSGNTVSGINAIAGGAYNNGGYITIKGGSISDNRVSGTNAYGGSIFNNGGYLTLTQTAIVNNAAAGTTQGRAGGIFNNSGTVTITGSTISSNSAHASASDGLAGGILTQAGSLSVSGPSKIIRNFASDVGGGIYANGPVDISPDCTVNKNIPDNVYNP